MAGGASFDPKNTKPESDRARRAEAETVYRLIGIEELGALRDALAAEFADLPGLYGAESVPVAALLIEPRLRAADREIARRACLFATGADVPDGGGASYRAWRALAGEVRQRANILAVFGEAGYFLRQTGRHEWHGQCFVCGEGDDRLMVRTDPPARYWCRRCGLTGDAITAFRSLTGAGFFATVSHFAAEAGLPVPSVSGAVPRERSLRRLIELPAKGVRHAG